MRWMTLGAWATVFGWMISYGCLGSDNALTYGFFTATGPEYDNVAIEGYTSGILILLRESDKNMIYECTRKCLMTFGCKSFAINSGRRLCHLITYNGCSSPDVTYIQAEGIKSYDLRPADPGEPRISCKLESVSCDDRGRPYCTGQECNRCAATCWDDAVKDKSGYHKLWPYTPVQPVQQIPIRCSLGWQSLWVFYNNGTIDFQDYDTIWLQPVKLKLTIYYDDGTQLNSIFESFQVHNMTISVGNYVSGGGMNVWLAPFTDRSFWSPENSNCLPFFYPPMTSCLPSGTPSDQSVNSDEIKGFRWDQGDITHQDKWIDTIVLWVKAA
ncbi:uncharacterized protein [Palaemon carinicauda]|uniref:uncharacterized protein n=1 Tax=Palaemon carinicauda TaxID=392227 RepID=UPI0035B631F6